MSGLEVLGAIASSIALAQAVSGTLKAIDRLRGIGEIQQQCNGLKKEIAWIEGLISQAKLQSSTSSPSLSQQFPEAPEKHPLVSLVVQELQQILKELDDIVTKYPHPRTWRNKLHWVFEARKMEELQRRAHNAKQDLNTALQFRVSSMVERFDVRQEVLLHSVTQHGISYTSAAHIRPENSPSLLESSHLDPIQTPESSLEQHVPMSGSSGESTTEASEVTEVQRLSIAEDRNQVAICIKQESLVKVTTIQPLGSRRCGRDCQCRCHWSRQYNSGAWIRPLLGSWLVKYKAVEGSCKCGTNTGVELEYQLPRWLWSGMLAFKACQEPGLTCSLRLSRTLPDVNHTLSLIRVPSVLRDTINDGLVLFPDDCNSVGQNLIELAVLFECYESVGILLELWNNLLPKQGLPSRVGYQISANFVAAPELEYNEPVYSLLAKARSFSERDQVVDQTKVHRAVLEGARIIEALKQQPWAIDEFDNSGNTPINLAINFNNVSALAELIVSGADINQQDWRGHTPLLLAALLGRVEAMELLLMSKECRRQIHHQRHYSGTTALHEAVRKASPECVRMLLEAGASAHKEDMIGQAPLHLLATSKCDQQTAREIIHLLQDRHAHLDVRDQKGETPAFKAIRYNKLPVLRALVDAGASLSTLSVISQSILHMAARYANVDTLSYLASQNLTDLDPELRDIDNDTSLDLLSYCSEADEWQLTNCGRCPSLAEQEAFRALYFDLRMSTLKRLLLAAEKGDASASSQQIATLINKSDTENRPDDVAYWRGIEVYVKDERWDLVVEIIQEEYDETFKKLDQVLVQMNGKAEDQDNSDALSDKGAPDDDGEDSEDESV